MKHAREDYNRIQDTENKIPEDEPVFLLRAKDPCAAPVIAAWADMAEQLGADPRLVSGARETVAGMLKWQRLHGVKVPDGENAKQITTGRRTNFTPREIADHATAGKRGNGAPAEKT